MTTTNTTAKYAGLARNGFTGTQEDRELSFYKANGATSNNLADAENQFLVAKGFTTGTVDDKWTAYLISLGYTGSKDDMINRWWGNFPGSTVNMDFTLGTLDSRITFTRASAANYFNSSGALTSATTNTPRFDYDPVTLAPKGLLLEESRTNVLLNSATLSTQSVTTTAAARTLSFYGTGTITLSGTHTATVVGTGAFPSRKTYVFTPTAGTLTLTVTGTVQYAQLETGAFVTSYITTAGAQATRAVENAVISGTNFSNWFNATQGTFYTEFTYGTKLAGIRPFSLNDSTSNEVLEIVGASGAVPNTGAGVYWSGRVANAATIDTQNPYVTPTANGFRKFAGAYKVNDFASSCNGGTVGTDTVSAVPAVNRLVFEGYGGNSFLINGYISKLVYYPYRLPNATLKALST
jgi:hypothetical protein